MTEAPSRSAAGGSARGDRQNVTDWEALSPIAVDYEDALGPAKVQSNWNKLYSLAGLRAPNEDTQRAFRLAVYVYAAINGTSREGSYSGSITMSNGHSFEAAIIPNAVGKMQIRKFFRGNMTESYNALKQSKVLENDERFVAKVSSFGVSAQDAFATADWFANCPHFTPAERHAYDVSFNYSVTRARRNRQGRNLEEVEHGRLSENLDAQGSLDAPAGEGGRVSF